MSKSVRFCKQIPLGLYERFAAYATSAGMTERDALITILDRNLRLDTSAYASKEQSTSTQPKKLPISTLRANLKGVREKIAVKHEEKESIERRAGSITFAQQDDLYALYARAAEIKHQLGEDPRTADEVMRTFYQNELGRLQSDYDYNTERYDDLTDKGLQDYKEMEERINVLKDRL